MGCLCAQKLAQMAKLAASLNVKVGVPDTTALAAALSAKATVNAVADVAANIKLAAGLKFPAAAASAQLQAAAGAAAAIKLGLGIDPLSATASAQLAALAKTVQANSGPLAAPVPDLSALANLANLMSAAKHLGIDLFSPHASATLSAAVALAAKLSATANLGLSGAALANMQALVQVSLLVKASAALGVNLLEPGGVAKLSAALKVMASLQVPDVKMNLAALLSLLGLSNAVASVRAGLGVDLMAPGAAAKLTAALNAVASLKLQAAAAVKVGELSPFALALALKMDLKAMAALNVTALAAGAPDLGKLAFLASLTASAKLGLGVDLLGAFCSAACPLGK